MRPVSHVAAAGFGTCDLPEATCRRRAGGGIRYAIAWRRTISAIHVGANGDVQPGGVG